MTVVFLHGVAGSRATYGWLPDTVAGHAVVTLDFRGHGAAERTPGAYLIADYTADVVSVLRTVGPAVLVGHSLGGVVAWTAAQQVPELVLGAFLEDPPMLMGSPEGHAGNSAIPHFVQLRSVAGAWQREGASHDVASAWLAAQPGAEVQTSEALAARAYALLHLDVAALDPVIDGSLLAATDVVSPVGVPLLLLAAGREPAFPVAHEQQLTASHPGIEVVRVAGAGHSIHDERAHRDEYFARVSAFVEANGRR
jgi:pimeloyl-ACP methyl ester carboxylesterase